MKEFEGKVQLVLTGDKLDETAFYIMYGRIKPTARPQWFECMVIALVGVPPTTAYWVLHEDHIRGGVAYVLAGTRQAHVNIGILADSNNLIPFTGGRMTHGTA